LSWDAAPLAIDAIRYPTPRLEKYEFADQPLSVFTGDFDIVTTFRVPATAPSGPRKLAGKLRYQACDHRMCLPPRTLEFQLPIEVR